MVRKSRQPGSSNITYTYVGTDNSFAHPYVFRNMLLLEDNYCYVDDTIDSLGIHSYIGWTDPNSLNENDKIGSMRASWEIEAYGVATIAEAAEIGGTTGTIEIFNKLVNKNDLGDYNCQLAEETTIEYNGN